MTMPRESIRGGGGKVFSLDQFSAFHPLIPRRYVPAWQTDMKNRRLIIKVFLEWRVYYRVRCGGQSVLYLPVHVRCIGTTSMSLQLLRSCIGHSDSWCLCIVFVYDLQLIEKWLTPTFYRTAKRENWTPGKATSAISAMVEVGICVCMNFVHWIELKSPIIIVQVYACRLMCVQSYNKYGVHIPATINM